MINEKKLREKLTWMIKPFQKRGGVPADLTDRIIKIVKTLESQSRKTPKRQLELKVESLEAELAECRLWSMKVNPEEVEELAKLVETTDPEKAKKLRAVLEGMEAEDSGEKAKREKSWLK